MFEPGITLKLNVVTLIMATGFFGYVLLLAPGPRQPTSAESTLRVPARPASTQPASQRTDSIVGVATRPSATFSATPTPAPTGVPTWTPSLTPMPTAEAVTTPTVPSTPTPTTRHSVAPGEVLSTIAARYGVTVEAIVAANGLEDPNQLEVGQVLVIPELAP